MYLPFPRFARAILQELIHDCTSGKDIRSNSTNPALSDPTRLRIIAALLDGEDECGRPGGMHWVEQVRRFSPAARSPADKRLVRSRKQGRQVYVTLDDDHVAELFKRWPGSCTAWLSVSHQIFTDRRKSIYSMKKRKTTKFPITILVAGGFLLSSRLPFRDANRPNPDNSLPPTAVNPQGEQATSEIPRVSLEDAKAALDANSAVFVDVRGDSLYTVSHIPAPIDPSDRPEKSPDELNPADWIMTYCTYRRKIERPCGAHPLDDASPTTPLLGGHFAWLEADYPTEP